MPCSVSSALYIIVSVVCRLIYDVVGHDLRCRISTYDVVGSINAINIAYDILQDILYDIVYDM